LEAPAVRLLWLALVVLLGCAFSGDGCEARLGSSPSDVALGDEFTLAPGDSVRVGSRRLRVSFERVVEDSRCPSDAFCVSAGQVVIEAKAGTSDGARYQLRPGETVTVAGQQLRLLRVEPYPTTTSRIPAADYRATFVVDR
jgi:hypothetical protein